MPFDGTEFRALTVPDTGLFPIWSKHGWRLWFETHLGVAERNETARAFLRAPSLPDRGAAIVRLLQDARGLIEDPGNWTKGNYRSFSGLRCAVGALRAAARRLNDPSLGWSAHALLITVAKSRGFATVEAMNDRSSHAAILGAFDEAIMAAPTAARARQAAFAAE